MLDYNDIYEILRKEKYSETLQNLPKKFIQEFKEFVRDKKESASASTDLFSDSILKSKKQLENSISLFKEITLRRKKKLLNLAFVATETGIMKRDFENMLDVEREAFEKLVKSFEDEDKEISKILNGQEDKIEKNKMILFKQDVEQFIDHTGNTIGPFKVGQLANLDNEIVKILVEENKASLVDET